MQNVHWASSLESADGYIDSRYGQRVIGQLASNQRPGLDVWIVPDVRQRCT